jgi:exodeoxyribonuclease VII large subunit
VSLDLFDPVPEGDEAPTTAPSPPEPTIWTVSQINRVVRALLEDTLPPMWIAGEVANWKRAGSGHRYFTLKDESSQLRCVMWRGDAAKLPMDPEEGMRIRAFGQLTLYEARGDYQLTVRVVEGEEGEGLWKLAFDRLKGKLEEEGLLLPERKRPLPRFPQTVGVVTSLTGAALHDILTVLRRRAPWLRVLVRGARVQGEGAAQEIADALRVLAGSGQADVIIVGRGGGSREDLWAFNEEPVARAIAESPVPVVSAVGHEVDVTIADLVADARAPTPSAGAEAVAPDLEELLRYVEGAGIRLSRGLRRSVEGPRRLLTDRWGRLRRSGLDLVRPRRRALMDARGEMSRAIGAILQSRRFDLRRLGEKMDALSPLSTLKRGYAVPLDLEGRLLKAAADFVPGEAFQLRVLDGRVRAETKEVHKEEAHDG